MYDYYCYFGVQGGPGAPGAAQHIDSELKSCEAPGASGAPGTHNASIWN